ncbi:hypothetical protein AYL99_02972 [Fonsecaea erecta]|uniref:Uncharacterized protein n=1 Tax=Fonsecaea erecta TaxID=1367422 RepID=A0A178ZXM1_9EURO|nr:hypothetical protein AYL99_02972 [Fonsecaea erecta]OAP63745.1 hypothetical protein AYL99_02972 [Fonsecaea erecta]
MDSSDPQHLADGQAVRAVESLEAARRIDNFLSAHSQGKLPAHLAHLQSVKWATVTSKDGLPYLCGTKCKNPTEEIAGAPPNIEASDLSPQTRTANNPLPKDIAIFWDVQKKGLFDPDPKFLPAEKEAQDIGLKDHRIMDLGPLLPYELDFHNTSGWFFRFKNATGDFWDIITVLKCEHCILYYSDSPNLRWVTNRVV